MQKLGGSTTTRSSLKIKPTAISIPRDWRSFSSIRNHLSMFTPKMNKINISKLTESWSNIFCRNRWTWSLALRWEWRGGVGNITLRPRERSQIYCTSNIQLIEIRILQYYLIIQNWFCIMFLYRIFLGIFNIRIFIDGMYKSKNSK